MVGRAGDGSDAEFHVVDPEKSVTRPVAYRDIVILLRARKGRAEVYASVLGGLGIPVFAESGTGFFAAQEVRIRSQDDARLATNQLTRYLRMASSSASNQTSRSVESAAR